MAAPSPRRRSPALRIALRSAQLAGALLGATGVLLRHGLAARSREDRERAVGRALLHLCATLGATFIKLGQIASTRSDLLPGPVVEELSTLQDRVPAFGWEEVRRTVEEGLGAPVDELFAAFETEPLAAASVAQVHEARLPDGTRVAVKVRRPDIVEKAFLDRTILIFLARNLERFVPTLRLVSLEAAVRDFAAAVDQQLHLDNEARNNERFRRNFAEEEDVVFPALHRELCCDAVLTMEFIEGVHERDLAARGVDVHRIVEAGMRAVCRMIFLHGFVHADLHPGNIRFLPPGRIALLDLGLVGVLEDEDRITTAQLLFALATGDGPSVARLFYENAPHTATRDYGAYEREITAFVASVRDKGLANLQVTVEIGRIFDILRRHRIQARAHMTMVNLALMTAEGLGRRLAPDLSLTDEALPYLSEALGLAGTAAAAGRGGAEAG